MTYTGNPNGPRQLWSKWTFRVRELGRHVPKADVEANAQKWLRMGFGSAGRMRVTSQPVGWLIECVIEGPPAHDPGFVKAVTDQFKANFVAKGWGLLAVGTVAVRILAGDAEDGRPRAQLIELPAILEVQ